MRKYLKWWTLLPKEKKRILMENYNISVITYHDIKTVYAERGK